MKRKCESINLENMISINHIHYESQSPKFLILPVGIYDENVVEIYFLFCKCNYLMKYAVTYNYIDGI